jgi:hypothetical protein
MRRQPEGISGHVQLFKTPCLEEPKTPEHTRMMIVTDGGRNEHRLFFMTEESEESFFNFPGKS